MFTNRPTTGWQFWLEADQGFSLDKAKLKHWYSKEGQVFAFQPDDAKRPLIKRNAVAGQPALQFKGGQCLELFKFSRDKGPHTFLIIAKAKKGTLFSCQTGPFSLTETDLGNGWALTELVLDGYAMTKTIMIGANIYGNGDFFEGELALIAYRNEVLKPSVMASIRENLFQKYNLKAAECEAWCCSVMVPFLQKVREFFKW